MQRINTCKIRTLKHTHTFIQERISKQTNEQAHTQLRCLPSPLSSPFLLLSTKTMTLLPLSCPEFFFVAYWFLICFARVFAPIITVLSPPTQRKEVMTLRVVYKNEQIGTRVHRQGMQQDLGISRLTLVVDMFILNHN